MKLITLYRSLSLPAMILPVGVLAVGVDSHGSQVVWNVWSDGLMSAIS